MILSAIKKMMVVIDVIFSRKWTEFCIRFETLRNSFELKQSQNIQMNFDQFIWQICIAEHTIIGWKL